MNELVKTYRFLILMTILLSLSANSVLAQLSFTNNNPDSVRMIELYDRAKLMVSQGQMYDALRSSENALDLSMKLESSELELRLLEFIGDIHVKRKRASDALPFFLKAAGTFELKEDSTHLVRVYTKIAQSYRAEKVYSKEEEYYEKIFNLLSSDEEKKRLVIQSKIGSAAFHGANYERATHIFSALLINYAKGSIEWENIQMDLIRSFDIWEKYDSALFHCSELLPEFEKKGDEQKLFRLRNNIAYYQTLLKDYDAAAKNYLLALQGSDVQDMDGEESAKMMTNIAICYANMGRRNYALDYFNEAIVLLEEEAMWAEKSRNENMLANLYFNTSDLYNAGLFCRNAITSARRAPDAWKEAEAYHTYSKVLREGNDPVNALSYYERYLTIRDSIEFSRRFQMELLENRKSQLEREEKELKLQLKEEEISELAIKQLTLKNERMVQEQELLVQQRSLDLLKQDSLKQSMEIEAEKYKVEEQKKENRLLEQEKMIQEKENHEQAMKLEAEERENILLENQQRLSQLENERLENAKKANFWALMASGIVMFLILASLFSARRKNQQIKEKNTDLEQKNEEIGAQRDEIEAQRDLVFDQKHAIEAYNDDIMKSIEYGKRLQAAALPALALLTEHVDDNFVYFKPRDVVSGDFYWFAYVEDKLVVTVADCTGHGVPGAFMSMMGMSLLKELVQKEYITHPGVILRRMRKEIINSLGQKGISGEQRDGMDMALVTIDSKERKISYAGAYNSLYLVRAKDLSPPILESGVLEANMQLNDHALYVIPADKMPVAHFDRMDKFNNHEIPVEKGDVIYMFSDGYPDQFGGEKGKKFMYKRFKELLLSNSQKSMKSQHDLLSSTLEKWKGNIDQVDDICVMGIKF